MKSEHTKRVALHDGINEVYYQNGERIAISYGENDTEAIGKAVIICDAFNVANETGMTPRELQKSHAELFDALENLLTKTELYHDFSSHVIEARRSAWKAIDNATKNTKP